MAKSIVVQEARPVLSNFYNFCKKPALKFKYNLHLHTISYNVLRYPIICVRSVSSLPSSPSSSFQEPS